MRQELEDRRGLFFGADLIGAPELAQIRCFDCTEVSEMAYALSDDMCRRDVVTSQVAFLPAPMTWIEWFIKGTTRRAGFMLQALEDEPAAAVYQVMTLTPAELKPRPDLVHMAGKTNLALFGLLWLGEDARPDGLRLPKQLVDIDFPDPNNGHIQLIYALLAIINTPRLIGQSHHAPHKGLQRQLRQSGKFGDAPLLQWTKVRLSVLDVTERRASGDASGVLTGQRALHFCRSFIRIRLGKLELVKAHMRGHAELGERRPVYVVEPRTPIPQPGQTAGP
jgi:hypothetical protein